MKKYNRLKEASKPYKSKYSQKVLELMDQDWSYQDAVKKVSDEYKVNIRQLEIELRPFI